MSGREQESLVVVAVIAHKPYRIPKDPIYLPLHVGATLHPEVLPEWAQDNDGDNISVRNPAYSELTGLYWLWKNVNATYKGIVHYRRHFATQNIVRRLFTRDRFNRIAREHEICGLLQDHDILVPKKRNYYIETVYSHYIHTIQDGENQLINTRAVIKEHEPSYIPAFDLVMASRKAHMFNMLIMSQEKLDEYCSWLFPILEQLDRRIDSSNYDAFNMRYPGRISEMLLDVWLKTKGYEYKELPVLNTEPVNWWKKGTSFLMAKFRNRRYIKSF